MYSQVMFHRDVGTLDAENARPENDGQILRGLENDGPLKLRSICECYGRRRQTPASVTIVWPSVGGQTSNSRWRLSSSVTLAYAT